MSLTCDSNIQYDTSEPQSVHMKKQPEENGLASLLHLERIEEEKGKGLLVLLHH